MTAGRREKALRRISRWQSVKVQLVSRRVAEAHSIIDALNNRLSELKTRCADAERGALETAFSLGPQQALAALRHSEKLRGECDDIERKTHSAREIVERLQELRSQEEVLRKQAERLAEKRKAERHRAGERREVMAIEDLILTGRKGRPNR